ncbi:hypothetical protein CORC01_13137 [Colletotrichum orchidophilum]|uniref:Uncharacterized protein n=1 Tax=Colletotrichum orchidophilum TaxID=1209926 RepID=A0A1G4AQU8_9PEZI|nr:uncharacterized protein CORC01_13137 [Colletotrichum orchidophilum]OHE91540.1 hypothetical protein CORC01_13137 [Colletotrichum orchidophilum]
MLPPETRWRRGHIFAHRRFSHARKGEGGAAISSLGPPSPAILPSLAAQGIIHYQLPYHGRCQQSAAAAAAPATCLIEKKGRKEMRGVLAAVVETASSSPSLLRGAEFSLHNAAVQDRLGQGSRELPSPPPPLLLLSWTLMTEGGRRGEAPLLL